MKYSVGLFYVFFTATYFDPTLGDKEVDQDVDCPLKTTTGRRAPLKILEALINIEAECMNETIDLDMTRLQVLRGLEKHREFFRGLCSGRAVTRECFHARHAQWTECYNKTMGSVFTIFADVLDSALQKGCVDEGERLAIITDGFHRYTEDYNARNPFVRECIIYSTARWMRVLHSRADVATKIWFLYKALGSFQQCFAEYIPEDSLVSVSVRHMEEVLDEMKCIHPVDEKLVLCKTVESGLIDRAGACPVRMREESTLPVSVMLERRLFGCFVVYEPYGQKLSDATTRAQFDAYFSNYCRRNNNVRLCLNETTSSAEVCLHDPEFKNFQLGSEYLLTALEAGCSEQGRRLANFFYTAKSLQNDTEERAGLLSCLEKTQTANTIRMDEPTRLYRLYRELPVVRQCFVDKMADDRAYVEDMTGFINEIMAKMQCLDPENGDVVMCQTLENSVTVPDSIS